MTNTPHPITVPTDYAPDSRLLQNRVILITGAGDGLGKATALACARHGAIVVLLGRTVHKLEKTYDEIEQAGGAKPAIYPLNLSGAGWNDYGDLAATLERELGRLDGIAHCAAHFKQFSSLDDIVPHDWMETLQVNLTGAYALTRQCLPLLLRSPDASVVFVTDAAGREAKAFQGAYGVSKAALENLARMWALELETRGNLRFNTWYPGPMRTALRIKGYSGEITSQLPTPGSVAPALLWLLGPDSRGVNGRAL